MEEYKVHIVKEDNQIRNITFLVYCVAFILWSHDISTNKPNAIEDSAASDEFVKKYEMNENYGTSSKAKYSGKATDQFKNNFIAPNETPNTNKETSVLSKNNWAE